MRESATAALPGDVSVRQGPAQWHPTVEEHQSLVTLLGSDGSDLDGLSGSFGADVLPYVVKAQCRELIRLRALVEDLCVAGQSVDAMLGGLLGVTLPDPENGADPESRRLTEDVYQVGVSMRTRIERLEHENATLRAHLESLADGRQTDHLVVIGAPEERA